MSFYLFQLSYSFKMYVNNKTMKLVYENTLLVITKENTNI